MKKKIIIACLPLMLAAQQASAFEIFNGSGDCVASGVLGGVLGRLAAHDSDVARRNSAIGGALLGNIGCSAVKQWNAQQVQIDLHQQQIDGIKAVQAEQGETQFQKVFTQTKIINQSSKTLKESTFNTISKMRDIAHKNAGTITVVVPANAAWLAEAMPDGIDQVLQDTTLKNKVVVIVSKPQQQ